MRIDVQVNRTSFCWFLRVLKMFDLFVLLCQPTKQQIFFRKWFSIWLPKTNQSSGLVCQIVLASRQSWSWKVVKKVMQMHRNYIYLTACDDGFMFAAGNYESFVVSEGICKASMHLRFSSSQLRFAWSRLWRFSRFKVSLKRHLNIFHPRLA